MAKYSFEFKKEIVVAYLSGKGGFGSLAKDYGIPNKAQIYRWVKAYQKLGDDGLRRARSIIRSCIIFIGKNKGKKEIPSSQSYSFSL